MNVLKICFHFFGGKKNLPVVPHQFYIQVLQFLINADNTSIRTKFNYFKLD